jgi:hypothetical protein
MQGILGKVAIAKDPRGDRVQPVAGRMDQSRERIAIAVTGSDD